MRHLMYQLQNNQQNLSITKQKHTLNLNKIQHQDNKNQSIQSIKQLITNQKHICCK